MACGAGYRQCVGALTYNAVCVSATAALYRGDPSGVYGC